MQFTSRKFLSLSGGSFLKPITLDKTNHTTSSNSPRSLREYHTTTHNDNDKKYASDNYNDKKYSSANENDKKYASDNTLNNEEPPEEDTNMIISTKIIEGLTEDELKKEFSIPTVFTQFRKKGKTRRVIVKVVGGIFYLYGVKEQHHSKSFPITNIREIRKGFKSTVFEEVKDIAIEECCFSIVYGCMQTISLQANYEYTADKWIIGLYHYCQVMSQFTQNSQMNYFKGIFQSKEKEEINFKELKELFLLLNIHFSKEIITRFRSLFNDRNSDNNTNNNNNNNTNNKNNNDNNNISRYRKLRENKIGRKIKNKLTNSNHNNIIDTNETDEKHIVVHNNNNNNNKSKEYKNQLFNFEKFYEIILEMSKRKENEKIYFKYAKNKEEMTKEELFSFVTEEQKEKISMEKIENYLNSFKEEHNNSPFNFNSFEIYINSSNYNPIIDPRYLSTVHQSMDFPLSDYYIKTSHNSYLEGNQLAGKSSVNMYVNLLKSSYRCIELDCWDGAEGEPIIFHGYTRTSKILFSDVCKCIYSYAFSATPFPLILSIELHCSKEQQKVMATIFRLYLGEMIALPQKNLTKLPSPNDLRNKILIKSIYDAKELGDLVYFGITGIKGMEGMDQQLDMVLNIPENLSTLPQLLHWNKLHLTRIYPKGTRISSSNFNPSIAWSFGSQLVALNAQTKGKNIWLSDGKFKMNGDCGYFLKPSPLLSSSGADLNTDNFHLSSSANPILLSIFVFGVRNLPVRKEGRVVSPCLSVYIYGIHSDQQVRSTHIIRNNGFNPDWNERLEFKINLPEAAIILFTIYDYNSKISKLSNSQKLRREKICYFTTSLEYINQGYRAIPMQCTDSYNLLPFCDLFCHISATSLSSISGE